MISQDGQREGVLREWDSGRRNSYLVLAYLAPTQRRAAPQLNSATRFRSCRSSSRRRPRLEDTHAGAQCWADKSKCRDALPFINSLNTYWSVQFSEPGALPCVVKYGAPPPLLPPLP